MAAVLFRAGSSKAPQVVGQRCWGVSHVGFRVLNAATKAEMTALRRPQSSSSSRSTSHLDEGLGLDCSVYLVNYIREYSSARSDSDLCICTRALAVSFGFSSVSVRRSEISYG